MDISASLADRTRWRWIHGRGFFCHIPKWSRLSRQFGVGGAKAVVLRRCYVAHCHGFTVNEYHRYVTLVFPDRTWQRSVHRGPATVDRGGPTVAKYDPSFIVRLIIDGQLSIDVAQIVLRFSDLLQ